MLALHFRSRYPAGMTFRTGLITGFAFMLMFHTPVSAAPELRQVLDPAEPGRGDSLLWTALPAQCWQGLAREAGVAAIDFQPEQKSGAAEVQARTRALGETSAKLENAFPAGSRSWSGPGTPEFVRGINQELGTIFPGAGYQVTLPPNPGAGRLMAVSVMNHRLEFARGFFRPEGQTLKFTPSHGPAQKVSFFGTKGKANENYTWAHLQIHSYTGPAGFVIELKTKSGDESVWVVREQAVAPLAAHLGMVAKAREAPAPAVEAVADRMLNALDVLQIPCLEFNHSADHVRSLAGSFMGKDGGGTEMPFRITDFRQWIHFEMDESGARIRASSETGEEPFGSLPPRPKPQPRKFICDGPFSVILWRTDAAVPYAAFHLDGGKWN